MTSPLFVVYLQRVVAGPGFVPCKLPAHPLCQILWLFLDPSSADLEGFSLQSAVFLLLLQKLGRCLLWWKASA